MNDTAHDTQFQRARDALLHHGWPYALLAVLALAVAAGGDALRATLRYERSALLTGEGWRLLTGHLVHLGPRHLALNLAGLGLIWLLCGRILGAWQWLGLSVFSMLGISLAFLLFEPQLAWYVGLSGMLHALLTTGALAAILARDPFGWPLIAIVAAKTLWEQFAGPETLTAGFVEGPVVVAAHFYGVLAGLVWGVGLAVLRLTGRQRRV